MINIFYWSNCSSVSHSNQKQSKSLYATAFYLTVCNPQWVYLEGSSERKKGCLT